MLYSEKFCCGQTLFSCVYLLYNSQQTKINDFSSQICQFLEKKWADPFPGLLTNHIGSIWEETDKKLKDMNGVFDLWLTVHAEEFR